MIAIWAVQISINILANLWLYHKVDKERKNYLLFKIWGDIFVKPWVLFTQGYLVPSLVEMGED